LLGLGECRLVGLDFSLHDDPQRYREAVAFIKSDPLSFGALVTSHKMDLLAACADLFDELDPLAGEMGEVSSIYKRDGKLCGRTVDPVTGGLALELFLPDKHFRETGAQVLILGAGGSALALLWHLLRGKAEVGVPKKIHVANRSQPRLDHLMELAGKWGGERIVTTHLTPGTEMADEILAYLPAGSLVVNATGLGKDIPGSPLTDAAVFPRDGLVWEFNYRGELLFLEQANRQKIGRHLLIEDGWRYFVIGWSQVIGDVFDVAMPTQGRLFDELSRVAGEAR
jgi:shikimate 5-dehydrogenase